MAEGGHSDSGSDNERAKGIFERMLEMEPQRLDRSGSPTSGIVCNSDFIPGRLNMTWEQEAQAFEKALRLYIHHRNGQQPVINAAIQCSLLSVLSNSWDSRFADAYLQTNLIPLIKDTQRAPLRDKDMKHNYDSIYLASWGSERDVLVKEAANTPNNRLLIAHEVEMMQTFDGFTPRFLTLEQSQSKFYFKVAVKYYPLSLKDVMDECDNEANWNIASELFRLMAEVERKGFYLRDFRLESFRVEKGKYLEIYIY